MSLPDMYQEFPGYHGIQVTDLPAYAKDGVVAIRGNNQAFFFRDEVKEDGAVIDIKPNEARLKTLLQKIHAQGDNPVERTKFTMAIDADVMEPLGLQDELKTALKKPVNRMTEEEKTALGQALQHHPAIKKYAEYRSEEPPVNIILFAKEIDILQTFVKEGGVQRLTGEIFDEATPPIRDIARKNAAIKGFAKENFRLMAVPAHAEGEDAAQDIGMKSAAWKVDLRAERGGETSDQFLAMQDYPKATHHLERPWRTGLRLQVEAVKDNLQHQDQEGAEKLLQAVDEMDRQLEQGENLSIAYPYVQEREIGRESGGRGGR